VQREFMEELGEPIAAPKLVTVLESIYTHHGAQGHEIVFVFATAFTDVAVYARDSFRFRDGGVDNTAQCGRHRPFPQTAKSISSRPALLGIV